MIVHQHNQIQVKCKKNATKGRKSKCFKSKCFFSGTSGSSTTSDSSTTSSSSTPTIKIETCSSPDDGNCKPKSGM